MALGQNDVFEAGVQLANRCRIAVRDGVPFGGGVADGVRTLARVMRETGALPEQMVITVKDALRLGGAGPAQTAHYGEHTFGRALVENLVTLAIDEYYASEVPAIPLEDAENWDERKYASSAHLQSGFGNTNRTASQPSIQP